MLDSIKKKAKELEAREGRKRESWRAYVRGFSSPWGLRVEWPTPQLLVPLWPRLRYVRRDRPSRNYFITQTAVLTCIVPLLHEGAPSNNICDESLALPSSPFLPPCFYTGAIWSLVSYTCLAELSRGCLQDADFAKFFFT